MPWAPSYASGAELAAWLKPATVVADVVADSAELSIATEAASRAIDRATGRQFGRVDAPELRHFEAEFHRGRWYVDIPDLMLSPTNVATEDGMPVTEYTVTPRNAVAQGRPWTTMELPSLGRSSLAITARWGWTTVPSAIKLATIIQAARFYDRRASVTGALRTSRVDDVSVGWAVSATDLDPDVLASLASYRRLWVAA